MYQEDTSGQGRSHDAFDDLPDAGVERRPDNRPILLPHVTSHNTEEYKSDRGDILDLVRARIKERGLKPMDLRRAGISNWNAQKHWRLQEGSYDDISPRVMYQLCTAVRLRRTKQLPWSL
ncbi:hypothetical protein [Methylobacterium indicum]|uniref:Uncharacterized protein n=1 Tax=Methylobacterium indicum TaxID=1775910 RepID=A0A8H8WSF1_9HYPH|nr:hypothetical protein [Methylobacterium indicum]BCM83575.1 hypothetical protein mvi_20360 [Methylobacterium indicum]